MQFLRTPTRSGVAEARKPDRLKVESQPPGVPIDPRLRLAAIVESSEDAILSKTLQGIITSWNAAAERIFGYRPEEIIGRSILTLIPPELQHEEAEILRRIKQGQKIEHYETTRVRNDGSRLEVSLTISPIIDDRGIVIGASKIARDIPDRRRFQEAHSRLAAIVDSAEDAIISKNLSGIVTSWNRAATRLLGWEEHEILGRSILLIIPKDLYGQEQEILRRLRAGEQIDHFETYRRHKDGHLVDVSLTVSPIRDAQGRVIGASKIARDISERNRMQQALIESEKLAVTGRMAAAIAHEINNPLESSTNLAYLLCQDKTLHSTAHAYASLLLEEITRAGEVTKQTLAFYRDPGVPVETDVTRLLDNLLHLNRPRLEKKKIVVRRTCTTEKQVVAYASELRQVFANLLLNAIDAVSPGGVITLHVSKARVSNSAETGVRVIIADNGPGIDPQVRQNLFRPFFTTKAGKGTGLGLWVSQGIIEKHGGRIAVRSSNIPGHSGTIFSVTLPRNGLADRSRRQAA